ncbi:hypothetical protein T265_10854 [Opisthorchis viverrini]|uniref:Uncharacterized protein n=1 Tax=Opisthorchis viverrini TaxID=6198 RepID=A0A074Z0V3_OPIVI|nr:hypothetical protein T265_10854 [Opisthorchis viverrini]KER20646.1 hypothetical protein T265_10854 [Opisthorchis viverrini]
MPTAQGVGKGNATGRGILETKVSRCYLPGFSFVEGKHYRLGTLTVMDRDRAHMTDVNVSTGIIHADHTSNGRRQYSHSFQSVVTGRQLEPIRHLRNINNKRSIKETTHKVAENPSTAYDRFRPFWGSSGRRSP